MDNKKLIDYAKTIRAEVILEGLDFETISIPILVVLKKESFHTEILKLSLVDNHIITESLLLLFTG